MRTLTSRVVALAVAVALAGALITGLALARASGSTNREQAAVALRIQANLMAAVQSARANRLAEGQVAPSVRAMQRALEADLGVVSAVVDTTQSGAWLPAPFTADDLTALRAGRALRARRVTGGRSWIIAGRLTRTDDAILLAQPVDRVLGLTGPQGRRLVIGLLLGLGGGALAGLVLVRTVTRPLARVAEVARRLSAGRRDVRVPAGGPLEVADVAQALNGLAHALTISEQRQKVFLMSVSHELRTPLTAVTGYAEFACHPDGVSWRCRRWVAVGAVVSCASFGFSLKCFVWDDRTRLRLVGSATVCDKCRTPAGINRWPVARRGLGRWVPDGRRRPAVTR